MQKHTNERTQWQSQQLWAMKQFGSCQLGDTRRTKRLIDYAARQVDDPESSTYRVCRGDEAAAEGAYRLLENDEVLPEAIEAGPVRWTAEQAARCEVVLAVQDTTSVSYDHSVAKQLGELGGHQGHEARGFWVHSTLMVDAQARDPIGLIDQQRWLREDKRPGKAKRRQRAYEDKESFKWQQASEQMCERLERTDNVVTVADREADVFEYVHFLVQHEQRFVIRAAQDRCLETKGEHLWALMAKQPVLGKRLVEIQQRGEQRAKKGQKKRAGRSARQAVVTVHAGRVTLLPPRHGSTNGNEPLCVNVVYVKEAHAPKGEKPIEWMLLTLEPIDSEEHVNRVIGYYECRWLIEEFHKAWKTGCGLEQRRLRHIDNLERLMVVLAPAAVRLLRLRSLLHARPSAPCNIVLSTDHWRCLYAAVNPNKKRLPKKPPRLDWALESIARLGGWCKTKRNPQPGWITLWRGWLDLERYVEGWRLARR